MLFRSQFGRWHTVDRGGQRFGWINHARFDRFVSGRANRIGRGAQGRIGKRFRQRQFLSIPTVTIWEDRASDLLSNQFFHDMSMDIGQPEIASGKAVGQSFVVQPEQMQDGGVQVMDRNNLLHGPKTEFIRGTMRVTATDAATCQPAREPVMIMEIGRAHV
mgnify:CR=1 FL=1